jgi:hypothetical protein
VSPLSKVAEELRNLADKFMNKKELRSIMENFSVLERLIRVNYNKLEKEGYYGQYFSS